MTPPYPTLTTVKDSDGDDDNLRVQTTHYSYGLRKRPSEPQPQPKKKRAKKATNSKRKPKQPSLYKRGKYSKSGGGLDHPKPGSRRGYQPLSAEESRWLRDVKEKTADELMCIYQVRGWRVNRNKWIYEGKAYDRNKAELLDAEWLNKNHMGPDFRKNTFQKKPCHWYYVPVLKTRRLKIGGCIPLSIIKFYKYVVMVQLAKELERRFVNGITEWGLCVDFIYRNMGYRGFKMTKPSCIDLTRDLIVEGQKKILYLMQISAIKEATRNIDNSHAVCVFDGYIFDANHDDPLPLSKDNLDSCCLGGPQWTFYHVSRVRKYEPGKKLKRRFPRFREVTSFGV